MLTAGRYRMPAPGTKLTSKFNGGSGQFGLLPIKQVHSTPGQTLTLIGVYGPG